MPCRQHPGSQTQSQSTLAVGKGHLLFLTFLFPAAQRSKDISLVAVPVISPNGCDPLAQGLGGQAAEGQRTSDLSLRIEGKRERQDDLPHPRNRGLRVFPPSAAGSALLGVPKSHPAWRRSEGAAVGEVRSSLNSYSSQACCSCFELPISFLVTGSQAWGSEPQCYFEARLPGRVWVDEICSVFRPWAVLFLSHCLP